MVNKTPSPTFAMMGDCFASGRKITADIYPIEISNQVNKRYQKKKIKKNKNKNNNRKKISTNCACLMEAAIIVRAAFMYI
jgi:uncharacterized membrane protein